jgi:hypothetical protein
MEIKGQQIRIRGMNKDLSYSAYNPEYSYDNKNIRINAMGPNSLFGISNEKGNLEIIYTPARLNTENGYSISGESPSDFMYSESLDVVEIDGEIIGFCEVKDVAVIFTTDSNGGDKIYLLDGYDADNNSCGISLYYSGDLNFNSTNKIQTLPFYENDSFKKVY